MIKRRKQGRRRGCKSEVSGSGKHELATGIWDDKLILPRILLDLQFELPVLGFPKTHVHKIAMYMLDCIRWKRLPERRLRCHLATSPSPQPMSHDFRS